MGKTVYLDIVNLDKSGRMENKKCYLSLRWLNIFIPLIFCSIIIHRRTDIILVSSNGIIN